MKKNTTKIVPGLKALVLVLIALISIHGASAYAKIDNGNEEEIAIVSTTITSAAVEQVTEEVKSEVKKEEKKKEYTIKRYATTDLNLRTSTSLKSKVKKVIPRGTKIMCHEVKGKWGEVKVTINNKTYKGYVSTKYLSKSKPKKSNKQYIGTYELTAYYNAYGNHTASGTWPTAGRTVAINGIPLGTRVYIEGIGERVVEDRGGMGYSVVDLYMNTYNECVQFGRKYNRKVYILK